MLAAESMNGCTAKLRMQKSEAGAAESTEPYVTDNSNYIIDLFFDAAPIASKEAAVAQLSSMVGVVEHGIFMNMATVVIVASSGGIRTMHRSKI